MRLYRPKLLCRWRTGDAWVGFTRPRIAPVAAAWIGPLYLSWYTHNPSCPS
jgi:hypothetical protein